MSKTRKFKFPSQDYSEDQFYPKKTAQKQRWKEKNYQGGIFSDSEIGGEAQDQQNPWQGSQEKWNQP